ncbi:MAG: substrate-binding domain-containing protein [Clostridia bacterium]|nr:substrate-binding domain-containing protein [Clostridia bacterium]
MKMISKLLVATLIVALLLTSFACAPAQTAVPASEQPAAAPAANTGATVGVCLYARRSQSDKDAEAGIRAAAAAQGLNVIIEDADSDPDRQIAHMQSFIDQKVSAILLAAADYDKLAPSVEAAAEAGIPVIAYYQEVNTDKTTSFIHFDYAADGSKVAEWLIDHINTNMGGAAKIGIIDFASCTTICQRRLKALYEDVSAACPGVEWVAKFDGNGRKPQSMDACEKIFSAAPDTQILIVVNEDAAEGAKIITEDLKKDVIIVGNAYSDDVFEALEANDPLYKAFSVDPYYDMGVAAIDAAAAVLEGGEVQPEQILSCHMLSNENIGTYDWRAIAAKRG